MQLIIKTRLWCFFVKLFTIRTALTWYCPSNVVLEIVSFNFHKRRLIDVSKVKKDEEFWDFDYETAFETNRKIAQFGNLELSDNRINN